MGWYASRTVTVQDEPLWVTLAAFVDYHSTDNPVLVKIGSVVLLYNRAKSFNSGTGMMSDLVTLTNVSPTGTNLLAGLHVGDQHVFDFGWKVGVCWSVADVGYDAVIVHVVRLYDDLCSFPTPSPTVDPHTAFGKTLSFWEWFLKAIFSLFKGPS